MSQLSRLKDSEISNGNLIDADDIDSELNQLVNESNAQDTRLDTIEGAYASLSGTNAFTGNTSFAARVQFKDDGELTISSGAITVTGANHTVDTESDAASDDLDTISGGTDGALLYLQAENTARTVVLKHGTGNIHHASGEDITLDDTEKVVHLLYSSALTKWVVVAKSAGDALDDLSDVVITSASNGQHLVYNGSNFVNGYHPIVVLVEQQAANTSGDAFSSGADRTVPLNTEVVDTGSICTLSSDQFTLPAGTYFYRYGVTGRDVNGFFGWLYDTTAAAEISGSSSFSAASSVTGEEDTVVAEMTGVFTLSGTSTLELRGRCKTTGVYGDPNNLNSRTERYNFIVLEKIA